MGGGPSSEQKAAAAAQATATKQTSDVANRQEQFAEAQQNYVNPFYKARLSGGLPYMNQYLDASSGLNARAFAPVRQQALARLGVQQGLPSGFREQALTDLDTQQARGFDQQLLTGLQANEQAKQGAAAGLTGQQQIANPLGYYNASMGGNQSIMQAPLQRPGVGGLVGGVVSGALSNPNVKLPFFGA